MSRNEDISACSRARRVGSARSLFEYMERTPELTPNAATFNALMTVYARVGDYASCASVLRSMVEAGYSCDARTCTPVLHALADAGHTDLALGGLRHVSSCRRARVLDALSVGVSRGSELGVVRVARGSELVSSFLQRNLQTQSISGGLVVT